MKTKFLVCVFFIFVILFSSCQGGVEGVKKSAFNFNLRGNSKDLPKDLIVTANTERNVYSSENEVEVFFNFINFFDFDIDELLVDFSEYDKSYLTNDFSLYNISGLTKKGGRKTETQLLSFSDNFDSYKFDIMMKYCFKIKTELSSNVCLTESGCSENKENDGFGGVLDLEILDKEIRKESIKFTLNIKNVGGYELLPMDFYPNCFREGEEIRDNFKLVKITLDDEEGECNTEGNYFSVDKFLEMECSFKKSLESDASSLEMEIETLNLGEKRFSFIAKKSLTYG